MLETEAPKVRAQARPLSRPAAHAVVRVAVLREHPAVAARDDAELDCREPLPPRPERAVPLERDPVEDPAAEPGVSRDHPVRAVGADEHRRFDAHAADRQLGSVRSKR